MPVKLTAARVAALAAHLPAPTPLGKRKHPSKEEALVGMAWVFPLANPTSLTNAQAAVSGEPHRVTPAEAARTKQKRYTTHGQSCRQVVVYASPPIVWKVDKVTNQINDLLVKSKQTVRVSSVSETRGALALETTTVPDAADLKVFESLFANAQKAPDGKLRCEVPTSKSCLKICDFPYHGLKPTRGDHGQLLPVPGMTLYEILMKSPLGGSIHLYEGHPPRLSRNSRTSDLGMMWFDIHDSRSGLSMKNLVRKSFMYGRHRLVIAPAEKCVGLAQCTRCWQFGHRSDARVCPFKTALCPLCSGPHSLTLYPPPQIEGNLDAARVLTVFKPLPSNE